MNSAQLRHLTKQQVASRVGASTKTIDRWVKAGKFPKPKRLGIGKIVWSKKEVSDYMENLPDCE